MTRDITDWSPDPETGAMPLAILEACAVGVLICRGFEEQIAHELVKTLTCPHPDFPVIELFKEVSSVILTLKAHGMIVGSMMQ